jgi:hypothetical protein
VQQHHRGVTVEVVVLPVFPESPVARVVVVDDVRADVVVVDRAGALDVVVTAVLVVVEPLLWWPPSPLRGSEVVVVVDAAPP